LFTWGMLEWWKPIADHPDAPGRSAGHYRSDDAKPDLGRPGRTHRAPAARDRPHHASPVSDGVGLWALVHLIGTVILRRWSSSRPGRLSLSLALYQLIGSVGGFWAPPGSHLGRRRSAQTSIAPFAAIAAGRNRFIPREIGFWRWGVALLVYALMLGGHAPVIGVSPFPA
jgi:hypothetical protein